MKSFSRNKTAAVPYAAAMIRAREATTMAISDLALITATALARFVDCFVRCAIKVSVHWRTARACYAKRLITSRRQQEKCSKQASK